MSETGINPALDTEALSQCCTDFYEQDWVRIVADDSFHPGGPELTRRTVKGMGLEPGSAVIDLGCGTGTTTSLLANQFGFRVTGLDLSQRNLDLASDRSGTSDVEFIRADAVKLPLGDDQFDGAIAECVLSIVRDRPGALREIKRVLKPGASLAITDMSLHKSLPEEFSKVLEPWTCLADALDSQGYENLFQAAGFDVLGSVDESAMLMTTTRNLKRKLLLAAAGGIAAGEIPFDVATVRKWLDRFEAAVTDGSIRYLRFHLKS